MSYGDEVHIHMGQHAGKFGRIEKVWISHYRIRINAECMGNGPKFVAMTGSMFSPISAIELLARLGKRAACA